MAAHPFSTSTIVHTTAPVPTASPRPTPGFSPTTMPNTSKLRVANPIAVRRYSVVGEPDRALVVTIGKPRPEPDPSVWMCSFLVEGIPEARRRIARGVDALDALKNAIEATRLLLKASGLVLSMQGYAPGEIGIPRPVPSYQGSGLEEKIERYIDRELTKFCRRAKARSDGRDATESKAKVQGSAPRRRARRPR